MESNVKRVKASITIQLDVGGLVELGTAHPVVVDGWVIGSDGDLVSSYAALPKTIKARILDALIVEALDRQRAEDAQQVPL